MVHHRSTDRDASDSSYRTLFERAGDAVLVADDSGRYIDANPAASALLGYSRDALMNMSVTDLVESAKFHDAVDGPVTQAEPGLGSLTAEGSVPATWSTFAAASRDTTGRTWLRRSDGSIAVCDFNATHGFLPGQHLSILRDVTAVVAAEEARHQADERFRRMLDSVDLLAVITDADGTNSFMNRAMLELSGVTTEELNGRSVWDSPHEEQHRAAFLDAIATGQLAQNWTTPASLPDGTEVTIRWSSAFIRDAHGQIEAVASLGEDITHRHRLEQQLHHAVKMESIGRLAGGIAHDFNNFLTVISGHVELALDAADLPEPVRTHLSHVDAATQRAAQLTRQLLAFGRQQTLQPEPVSVGSALNDLVGMLDPLLGGPITIEVVIDSTDDRIIFDRSKLDQVFVNLAVNSRDAMPNGGTLTFTVTDAVVPVDRAEVLSIDPGPYLTVAVTDTGSGIAAEVLDEIFEPFVTTKAPGDGSGLGLSTVFGIITQSGGAITVDADREIGTEFRLYLSRRGSTVASAKPDPTSPAAKLAPAADGATRPAEGSGTILLVDDDEGVRSVVEMVLRRAGHRVESHASPIKALESARARPFLLLLSDLVMKEMSGLELAERIGEIQPDLPTLFMSGYSEAAVRSSDTTGAHIDLIGKPFTSAELGDRIASALQRAGARKI